MSQQNIQFKAIPGQFNIDEAQGVVECFVAGIGNKDSVGDVLITGAFTKSLTRRKPRVVWGHNWNDPIGKVLEIYEVAPGDRRLPTKMLNAGIGGLYAKVQFNLNSEKGREAFANVAFFGQEQEWSIGYKTLDSIFDPNIQANILKEVELYEVSPVLHGANQLTGTISVKSDETAEKHMPGMMMPHHEGMGAGPKIVVVRQDNDDDDDDRPIFSEGLAQALGDNEKERLTRELQARSGSSIQLVSATESTAKFRRMTSDGRSVMYRIGYHTPDNYVTFMFGKPELAEGQQSSGSRTVVPSQMPSMPMQVKPGVPTGATNFVVNPEYVMPKGQDYEKSAFDQELENLAQILDETFDVKVGRTLSSRNMSKLKTVLETLQDIVSSAEKDVESKSGYIIPVQMEKAFETKQLLDPIFDYHRVESHVTEDGIVITTGVTQEFIEAIGVAEKALGRTLSGGLGKLGRAGRGAVNFDPKAWDGDGDGIVQEGTPYSRPAIPGVNDRASGGRVDVNAATRAWQNQRRSGMASRLGSDENSDEYDEAMGPPMRRPGRGMADDPVGDAASENLDRDRNAGAVRRGLSSSTGDIVSDPPENLVNDIANAAVRAVGRSGDETRLIDGAKEVLANLTDEKLRDSVGKSVSNARKRLAEMLSDEKIIEEFQSRKAIEDFMDEVGYAVQKMLDLHVSSVKKKGTSVEQEEIEEIVDNAKSKFDDDFNELVKASKEFWNKRRKPGKFDRTPEEAKKESALDRKNLMTTLREGGEPEDLEATIGSISKLFGEDSEKIISGTISAEDLTYVIERALVEIVDNDPSIDPKELANEFGDALREGASKDGANPLIVALAKEFGDEKITGGDLIDYLNGVREDSVYRPDRGKIQRENIRGFASRTGAGDEGKRPRLNEYELAAIEKMVEDTGLPRKLFDDLAVTERIGNPEDAFYQAQEYGLSKEKIRGLQSQYAKALKEAKGKRKGGFASRTGGGKRLSGDDFDENDSLTAKGRKKVFDYLVDNGTDKDEADSILDRWEQNDGTAEEYMQEYDKDDRDVIENIANAASSMYEDDMSSGGERQAERRKGGFSSRTGGISSNPADDPRITNVKKLKEDIADVFNRFRTTPFGLSENSTGDDRIKWERFTQNRLNETDGAIEALYAYLADMRDLEDSGVELSASQRKNIKTFKEDIGTLKRYRDNALANYRKVVGDEEADRRKATFATPVNVDRPSRGGFASETGGNPKREMDMTLAEYAELDKVLKKYMDDSQVDGIGADEDMQVIQDILDKLDESSAANDSIPLTDKEIDDYMDTLTRMRDNGPVEDSGDRESIDKLIDSLKKTKDSKDGIYESDALQQAGTRLTPPPSDKSRGGRGRTAKRPRGFKSYNGTINPHKKLDIELNDSEIGELRDELQGFIKISDNPAPLRAIAEKLEKATNGKFSVEKEEYEEVIKEIDKMRTSKRVVTSDVVTVLEQAAESQKGKYSSSDFGGGGGFSSSTGGRKNNGAPSDIPETMQKQLIMWGRQQGGLRLVQEAIQKFDQDNGTLPASYWKRLRTMYENMGPGSASGAARRGGRRGIFGRGKDKDTDATPTRSPGFIIDDTPAPSKGPISTDGWDKVGGQMGSQPGAKLKDPKTGKEYYVKEPKSQLHAENESLVTKLYDRLGIGVGRVQVGERSGKPKIVSEWLAGSKSVNHRQKLADSKWKKAVQDSFVATAWLANWDATANPGNIVEGADGKPYIIDSGGGLLFRARGDAKGSRFGAVVGEMDSLRDKNMNSLGYEYFNDIPPAEIARQVKEIGSLSDKEIRQMVESTVTDKAKAKEISDTLIARRDYLVKNWSTGKNSGTGRRGRVGMSSLSEGYAPRNKRPGESPATRPEDFEVRPRDGEPTGVGKGGAMGTKPDPKFTGDSFDQAKPEEWDELTIDEKWGWMLGEGNPEKGGTMSPAAYEGAMKKLGEEEAREELKQMTPEERRKARSASRASALSELSDNEKARLATEKEERQKRTQESSKRVKEEATAEAAQSKREKLLDAFNEWIDDSIRELSGMDYDETDINPDSEDIWDTVSTILGVEDITPKSLKEAIDELSSYVDITSGENAYEKKSLARANALLKKLLKMQSEYSEDKWFNGGEGGRSGFQSSTGGKPRPPRGIRPRPGTPEMPQSNAKREGDIKRLSTLIEQVVAELEAKRQNPSPKKGRMGFSSSTGKTMITDEATFFKDVENSLAKEIRAAQKARNTKAASGLTKLQEIIKRSEASKTGDRRTNTGSIYMTMDEVDLILDGLQFALDQQMDAGGDKRIGWYSKLIEKIAAAAMSTFIDKSTTEIGSTRRTVTNKDGVKKKINIVPEP